MSSDLSPKWAPAGINGRHCRPPHLSKDCLVDKVKFARQAVGCLRGEAVLLDGRLNHADNLLASWRQGGAVASQAELDPLDLFSGEGIASGF